MTTIIDASNLMAFADQDLVLECEARPGQFLTTFGGSSSFEAPCGVFRKPSADLSPFHLRVLPVKGGFQLRWTNLALGHHGWTGKFGAAGGTVQQVAVGVDGDAGTVSLHQGTNPWGQVEYWRLEPTRGYGAATLTDALVLAHRAAAPSDDAGKTATSFRFRLAEAVQPMPVPGQSIAIRNVATGQYIVLKPDPRGGGALEAADQPDTWLLYQGAGAEPNNFELKRANFRGFNWSNYDNKHDGAAFIAWNHAKRLPNTTTPAAPHPWYFDAMGDGTWVIRHAGGEVCELMPDLRLFIPNSTGPKIITRKLEDGNLRQRWTLE
jgi:hypothetical protein